MGFYRQRVSVVTPVLVGGDYGGGTLSYDESDGASVVAVPFGVDVQPRTIAEQHEDGTRVMVTVGLKLHTPPGKDLALEKNQAVRFARRDYDVIGEPARWPSDEFPSGVDHVTVDLELREG